MGKRLLKRLLEPVDNRRNKEYDKIGNKFYNIFILFNPHAVTNNFPLSPFKLRYPNLKLAK